MKKHSLLKRLVFLSVVAALTLPAVPTADAACVYNRYRDVSFWVYNHCTGPICADWYSAEVGGRITACDGSVTTWGQTTGYDFVVVNESYICPDPVCTEPH
jgi:hypothetical protein